MPQPSARGAGRASATGPTPSPVRRAARHGSALCLSGGGYRAALFHLGATRRLDELGILASLRTVSGVSGGSLVAQPARRPPTRSSRSSRRQAAVVGFEDCVADAVAAAHLPQHPHRCLPREAQAADNWSAPDAAIRALADELRPRPSVVVDPLACNAMARPAIITGATEIGYGVDWVFEGPTAHQPRGTGRRLPPGVCRVAAGCAAPRRRRGGLLRVPAVLRPDGASTVRGCRLRGGHRGLESPEERQRILRHIRLTDGGVYDNLGLEPVWKSHHTVLVSDGGGVFRARTERTIHGRTLRILGIATSGGQSVRSRWLQAGYHRGVLDGTSWALDTAAPAVLPAGGHRADQRRPHRPRRLHDAGAAGPRATRLPVGRGPGPGPCPGAGHPRRPCRTAPSRGRRPGSGRDGTAGLRGPDPPRRR